MSDKLKIDYVKPLTGFPCSTCGRTGWHRCIAAEKINALRSQLDKVREMVSTMRLADEHECLPEAYRYRCQHCEHNRDIDEILKALDAAGGVK